MTPTRDADTAAVSRSTYRNPWFNPASGHDPEFYTTDAKPARVGKYLRYHRIKSSSPGGNCYDFVLDGVCVTQRAGPGMTEAEIDAYREERS